MKRSLWIRGVVLVLLVTCTLFLSSCGRDDSDPYVDDPISVTGGKISGAKQDGMRIYKGIPYAAPPVGNLRWKPPAAVIPWSGVLACADWAPAAPQPYDDPMGNRGGIDEDCLYLNIVTPAERVSDGLPVMVFFHGGGLASHTGNSETYNNTSLPKKGVIIVTVNSRLGPIGYMAHPELTTESGYNGSGNYGTMDLVAALTWIKNNIGAFGGNANNVTIFGESGGGTKTISVITTPFGKGLFHKAIIESGDGAINPARSGSDLATQHAAGQKLFQALGVTTLAQARAKTWQQIIDAGTAASFSPTLTIDGRWLTKTVNAIFSAGEQGNFPLIVGGQSGEAMLKSTTPLIASLNAAVNPNTFIYVFSHLPPVWRDKCVAFHGLELPYVFAHIPGGLDTEIVQYLAPGGGCSPVANMTYDHLDLTVADNSASLWAQFAKTGNPSVSGLITWPTYSAASDAYLDIGNRAENGNPALKAKTGVVAAYTPPPVEEVTYITHTDSTYGFSVMYPDKWVAGAAAVPGVIWRVGGNGAYYIPPLRVIVRPSSQGATLQDVFAYHLTQDGNKTIKSITASSVNVHGYDYTKAAVAYASTAYTYDSKIMGRIVGGNWIIFEVYSVTYEFDTETQQDDILNSVTFP